MCYVNVDSSVLTRLIASGRASLIDRPAAPFRFPSSASGLFNSKVTLSSAFRPVAVRGTGLADARGAPRSFARHCVRNLSSRPRMPRWKEGAHAELESGPLVQPGDHRHRRRRTDGGSENIRELTELAPKNERRVRIAPHAHLTGQSAMRKEWRARRSLHAASPPRCGTQNKCGARNTHCVERGTLRNSNCDAATQLSGGGGGHCVVPSIPTLSHPLSARRPVAAFFWVFQFRRPRHSSTSAGLFAALAARSAFLGLGYAINLIREIRYGWTSFE